MRKLNIKKYYIYIIGGTLTLLFGYLAFIFYFISNKTTIADEIIYSRKDNSVHEVFYDGNRIFSGKTTDSGFIRKYTNQINIHFDYEIDYSDIVTGSQEYLVKASMVVYTPNGEAEIWRSEAEYLNQKQVITHLNEKRYKINTDVSIDYQKYLEMYNKFRSDTSIVSNAKIYVEFLSTSVAKHGLLKQISVNDTITYDIPISDVTYIITKKTTANGEEKQIIEYNENNLRKLIFSCLYIIAAFMSFASLFYTILKYIKRKKNDDYYEIELKKILKTYDSIIVNVEELPIIIDKSIINVTSFRELLDAQMELRLPINYKEIIKNQRAQFMIIGDKTVWTYTLLKKENEE